MAKPGTDNKFKNITDLDELNTEFAKVVTRQQELAQRNDDLTERLDEKGTVVADLQQRVAELKAQADAPTGGGAGDLEKYFVTEQDGTKAVQLTMKKDRACKDITYGLADDPETHGDWHAEFKRTCQDFSLMKNLFKGQRREPQLAAARVARCMEKAPDAVKNSPGWEAQTKLFFDGAGVGAEWILDLGLSEMAQDERLVGELEAAFSVKEMQAQTELLPYLSTHLRPYGHGNLSTHPDDDRAKYTLSDLGTDDRTISATGMVIRAQLDLEAEEDAIIAALPLVRSDAIDSLRWGMEDCILNGDSGPSHGDTIAAWDIRGIWGIASGPADDHRLTFKGLRHIAIDSSQSADESSGQDYAALLSYRNQLKSPMSIGENLLHVMSPNYYVSRILSMTQVVTLDVFGPQAAVLTGRIPAVAGVRILLSEFMDDELSASGVYDDTTKTKTGVVTVNTARFMVTRRGGDMVLSDIDVTRGVRDVLFKNRKGFFALDGLSANTSVYYAFNVAPA